MQRTSNRVAFLGLLILCLAPTWLSAEESCDRAATLTRKSCRVQSRADYRLELARCENLSVESDRSSCRKEARKILEDDLNSCEEQFQSREEICKDLGGTPYDPFIDPLRFTTVIDNPYLPLIPGTTFIYEGSGGAEGKHVEVVVTGDTRTILGVECVQVRDTVFEDGAVVEDTLDWYAQDDEGNVWYFGEAVLDYEDGYVFSIDGSFVAGENRAKPGIIMPASPEPGDFYRQEFDISNAEDLAEVLGVDESVIVPFGAFDHCLKNEEFAPLEPGIFEHKYYAPGIGNVLIVDLQSGDRTELVEVIR